MAYWASVSFAWPWRATQSLSPYLSEKVQCLVQVGIHARGRLIGDFDGVFQDALGDDVCLRGGGGLRTDEHTVVLVTARAVPLHLLVQGAQPSCHQVNVLQQGALPQARMDPPCTPSTIRPLNSTLSNTQQGGCPTPTLFALTGEEHVL